MKLGRRQLLKLGLLAPMAPMRAMAQDAPASPLVLGPYLCDPRSDAMGVFVQATPGSELELAATALGRPHAREHTQPFTLDSYGIGRADLIGLRPRTEYRYTIRSHGEAVAGARFRTLPRRVDRPVRLAFGADIHHWSKPYTVFEQVRAHRPDALFLLGDQVYADVGVPALPATEEAYRSLYPSNWDDPSLASCWAEVPTLLSWDDHEIWNDFDHTVGSERFAPAAAAYDAYQGLRNPCGVRGDVRWYTGRIGPCAYFVPDVRTHRRVGDSMDPHGRTVIGSAQRLALLRFLRETEAELKLLITPACLHDFTDTGRDAWGAGYRHERDFLLSVLAEERVGNVVVISGDLHWPAVIRHSFAPGREVYELQCTPIAAFARPPTTSTDPAILWHGDGSCVFGLLDVKTVRGRLEARFVFIDAMGRELYALDLPLA